MYQIMLVDDETIMRTTLHTLIDWRKYGFEIVCDAANGKQALQMLEQYTIHIIITDMKMPIMDGIELMKEIKKRNLYPLVIVLSGYNEFYLVREAFRLGAYDYLMKEDVNEITLANIAQNIYSILREKSIKDNETKINIFVNNKGKLADMALGKTEIEGTFLEKNYILVQFEIDDFLNTVSRFEDNLEETLIKPMLNFALQIPRVVSKCIITSLSASKYLLYYSNEKEMEEESFYNNVRSICQQIINVWKNYMNISVSGGISLRMKGKENFIKCFEQTQEILGLKYLYGRNNIFLYSNTYIVQIRTAIASKEKYMLLISSLKDSDNTKLSEIQEQVFNEFLNLSLEEAKRECLCIIYQLALMLKENNDNIWDIFKEDINYCDKIQRIDSVRGLTIWLTNYFRWVKDYIEHNYDRKQADIIERAKHFIWDNYANPEISLGMVASFVSLSEKYFSSRFTKETGSTFSNYLTEIRIRKAKQLLDKTDMKMYEISRTVGYNNVEHFTRVFKKVCEISPTAYKKTKEK